MSVARRRFGRRADRTLVESESRGVGKRPVLASVQALRAVAALFVVLMHMQLQRNGVDVFAHPLLGIFKEIGGFGVDLFFAISGFIMIVTNWNHFARPAAGWRFLQHRAIRIYPAYWFATLPILLVFLSARDRVMTGHVSGKTDLWATLLLYPQPVDHVLLPVSWTLVFELTFYLIFAGFLAMKRRYLLPSLGIWFAIQLGLWLAFATSPNPYLKYAATALPIEFIFGILAGMAYLNRRMPWSGVALPLGVSLIAAVWIDSVVVGHMPFDESLGRVIFFGIPAALILYGMVGAEMREAIRVPAALVALGNASYALYLWHFSIIGALRLIVVRLHPFGRVAEAFVLGGSLAIVVGISLAVYRFVEKPLTRALNGLAARSRRSETEPRPTLRPSVVTVNAMEE